MAKTIEVILRRKVGELGEVGDLVNVKAGYARNYLVPHGLAYQATEENRRRLEQEREAALAAEEQERQTAAEPPTRRKGREQRRVFHGSALRAPRLRRLASAR